MKASINIDLRGAYSELQTLDWKNPGSWSQWIYYLFSVLAIVVILAAGYYFIYAPRHQDLVQARRQEFRLRTEFEAKQRKVEALGAYKEQLTEMKHDFGNMLRQLPSKSEVANLLNDVSQARVAAGLREELFQPQAEIKKNFYAEIPNRIIVTGTYHELGSFVSAVAQLPRIVTIHQVTVNPVAKGEDQLRMSALLTTYRYIEGTEPGPAKKAKRGRR